MPGPDALQGSTNAATAIAMAARLPLIIDPSAIRYLIAGIHLNGQMAIAATRA